MNEENIKIFLEKVKLDPELLQKVSAIPAGPERPGALAELSTAAGVPISSAEWEAHLSKCEAELTDSELGSVAGGGFVFFTSPKSEFQRI